MRRKAICAAVLVVLMGAAARAEDGTGSFVASLPAAKENK